MDHCVFCRLGALVRSRALPSNQPTGNQMNRRDLLKGITVFALSPLTAITEAKPSKPLSIVEDIVEDSPWQVNGVERFRIDSSGNLWYSK